MESISIEFLPLLISSLLFCLGGFFSRKSKKDEGKGEGKNEDKEGTGTAPEGEVEEKEELEEETEPSEGLFARLRAGLSKTQGQFTKRLEGVLASSEKIGPETFDEMEEVLITSDLGVRTTMSLLEKLKAQVDRRKIKDPGALQDALRGELELILEEVECPLEVGMLDRPYVIMVIGVNGTGKTTTIGKLAMRLKGEGRSVLIAAADTFRAAAIEQLEIWGQRAGAPVVKHKEGSDPSAVAFDAVKAAQSRGVDVVIVDTAGRLHTKVNLMDELKKLKRIIGRELPGAPHEIMLVLDATTGQNAVQQTKMFNEALEITGIALTKLDGTAKGGVVIAISDEFKIPLRFIGVGEKIYDLQVFRAKDFVKALFE